MQASVDIESIRKFIVEHIPKARQMSIQDDEQLLENGLLDSLGILDVVTHLEEEFGISISDDELTPDNFQSIRTMYQYVQQKKSHLEASD
ncbi:MAG: acyl carrier protein [Nitrospirales bacterium]|nr:acyl carrier protein [Nitrospira sp.]MDR4501912.1 acyl carrier protein [Nitrospirales bacterium]